MALLNVLMLMLVLKLVAFQANRGRIIHLPSPTTGTTARIITAAAVAAATPPTTM
jgi:hypothetical protein